MGVYLDSNELSIVSELSEELSTSATSYSISNLIHFVPEAMERGLTTSSRKKTIGLNFLISGTFIPIRVYFTLYGMNSSLLYLHLPASQDHVNLHSCWTRILPFTE